MRMLLAFLACAMLAGCNAPKDRLATFDPAEYEPYAKSGSGVLAGQAFVRTRGGDVKYGAGREIVLNPVTNYSSEWYERGVKNYETLKDADPACPKGRTTIADAEGRFRFDGLPAGEYYVACWIFWDMNQYSQTGGVAHAKVKVQSGQTTNVIVTR